MDKLWSRGPDEGGVWDCEDVSLGHRRLSVIDLANGRQPLVSEDNKIAIVYNGEIYNFKELRTQLEIEGARFKSLCDTEVILVGYKYWGKDIIKKLDGIFAFCIFDHNKRTFLLARDRCGVKPLFYKENDGGFSFASTLSALCSVQNHNEQIDYNAVYDFLAFQTVLSPRSFLRSVKQLEPAHYMTFSIDENRVEVTPYWRIPQNTFKGSFNEAVSTASELIEDSVKAQLVSDVPIGAFLSGGIDSSLLVHYAAKHVTGRMETFNISFEGDDYDETNHAKKVSQKYNTNHHVIASQQITSDLLLESISCLDQPLADPAYPMTWLLSRETKKTISVALSGDGGDELFGGYAKFNDLANLHQDNVFKRILRWFYRRNLMTGKICSHMFCGKDRVFYKRVECGNFPGNRKHYEEFFNPEISKFLHGQPIEKWTSLVSKHGGFNDRTAMMKADLWTYLSENCMTKTDRASMSWGLEARVPLLSNNLLNFSLSLPQEIHFNGQIGKQILRTLASENLPETVWNRKKHGFSVPLKNLLKNEWKSICHDIILFGEKNVPIFNYKSVKLLRMQVLRGKGSMRLFYTIIVFLIWCRKNNSILKF